MDNRLKGIAAGAAGAFATVATRLGAAAQDTAAAGNGGTSDASASGGAVGIGDVNSGGNSANAVAIGDVGTADTVVYDKYGKPVHVEGGDAAVAIDGGDSSNSTSLDISADGGTAISDASGGDNNFAFVS